MSSIRTFELQGGKGSSENGRTLTAQWFAVAKGDIPARKDCWIATKFYVFPESPDFTGWCPHLNLHVVSDQEGWNAVNPSPVQLDFVNGKVRVYTHGGGSTQLDASNGIPPNLRQFRNVARNTFPFADDSKNPMLPKGRWVDFVLHVFEDEVNGSVEAWMDGAKFVDAKNIPTNYTGHTHTGLYDGIYADGNSNDYHVKMTLARIGATFEEMRADVPVLTTQWGALTTNTIKVTELAPIDSEDFKWPTELIPAPPVVPPVVVPPVVTPPVVVPPVIPPVPVFDFSAVKAFVSKFRKSSPNIAAAFDALMKELNK